MKIKGMPKALQVGSQRKLVKAVNHVPRRERLRGGIGEHVMTPQEIKWARDRKKLAEQKKAAQEAQQRIQQDIAERRKKLAAATTSLVSTLAAKAIAKHRANKK